MTIINGEQYDTYEQYCEEVLSYMYCQMESIDFGEGEMTMSSEGGEYAMYKFSILHYLNSLHDDNYKSWLKKQRIENLYKQLDDEYDVLGNEDLYHRLHNQYDKKMKYRKRRYSMVK